MTKGYALPGYDMPCFDSSLSDPESRIQSFIASSSLSNPFHSWRADQMPGEPDIDGWINRGIQPAMDIVPKTPDFMSIDRIDTYFSGRNQPVITSFNSVGKFESYKANGERYVRDFLESPVAGEFIRFIAGKGYRDPNEIKALGVEKGEGFYAGIFVDDTHRSHSGVLYHINKGTLIFSHNLKQSASELAHKMGFRGVAAERFAREFINSTIAHEILHNYRRAGSNEVNESRMGGLLAEFYSMMAERYKGTEKEEIYKAIAEGENAYSKKQTSKNHKESNEESELEETVNEVCEEDADGLEAECEGECSGSETSECTEGGEAAEAGDASE